MARPLLTETVESVIAAHAEGRPLRVRTSGTTGAPRVVRRSAASWWRSFEAYTEGCGVQDGARLWLPGPLSASMNLFAAVHAAVVGATVVEDPAVATHACLTPALMRRHRSELPHGCGVTVAGAAVEPVPDRPDLRLWSYYGATELSFVAAGNPLRPFGAANLEVREGVIWVRSPYLAEGYEPADPTGPLRRDGDWATVGDLGRLEDGLLRVLGRPDAINTAGVTVRLADVERALDPVAGPVVAFGLPHPEVGQLLAVASRSGAVATLRHRARQRLDPGHRPHAWFLIDQLPLTAAGKPDRRAVVAAALAGDLPRAGTA